VTPSKTIHLIDQFENCTLPIEQWTHEAHFIMAFYYCLQLPLPQAVQKIRQGIKAYNVSVGGQNTDTAGYHETITLFYATVIAHHIIRSGITVFCDEQVEVLVKQPFIAKEYALKFYSRQLLFSTAARKEWAQPDLQPLA